jgi:hypothetical protein
MGSAAPRIIQGTVKFRQKLSSFAKIAGRSGGRQAAPFRPEIPGSKSATQYSFAAAE